MKWAGEGGGRVFLRASKQGGLCVPHAQIAHNTFLMHMYLSKIRKKKKKNPRNSHQSEGRRSFPVWSVVLYTVILGMR